MKLVPVNDSVKEESGDIILCGFTEECDIYRFIVISILSLIAAIGLLSNGMLTWIFARYKCSNTPPTLYPTFLAILDGLICFFYILLFGVDVVMGYLKIESLFVIYHTYILPAFVLSKVTQLAIPYLLIFVTLERYAWISPNLKNFCLFSTMGRPISVICCLTVCAVLRSPPLWALTVETFKECPDFFRSLAVAPTEWVLDSQWYAFYDFWLMAFIQTFLPFFVLVSFNIIIVKRLAAVHSSEKQQNAQASPIPQSATNLLATPPKGDSRVRQKRSFSRIRMPAAVRNAVYTTLAIVASYLICNSLHLFLTILERSKSSLLDDKEDPTKASTFYTLLGDTVSALYCLSSATRILIYCKCNPFVKAHVIRIIGRQSEGKWLDYHEKNSFMTSSFSSLTIAKTNLGGEGESVDV
uniref:G_PROTEIN_RECEP_F1_2 domain-containing protein n=1 Tax=Panagrellus redivivus TaxID=6233 RepID=A0A7E4ZT69_PANRE